MTNEEIETALNLLRQYMEDYALERDIEAAFEVVMDVLRSELTYLTK